MTQMAIPIPLGTLCERCRSRPAVHTHHRQRRSQGGDDRNENLVRVCLECHQWIHDNPKDAMAAGWLVRSWQDPATVTVEVRDHSHAELAEGETCPTCHRKVPVKRTKVEGPRNRVVVSFKVPKDADEDGVALWDERIEAGRELLCEPMGWEEDVPVYYVAMALIDKGLEAAKEDILQAKMADIVTGLDA